MKTSIQIRNGVSSQIVELIVRLVDLIPWPVRRAAMGMRPYHFLMESLGLLRMYLAGIEPLLSWALMNSGPRLFVSMTFQTDASQRQRRRIRDCWPIL